MYASFDLYLVHVERDHQLLRYSEIVADVYGKEEIHNIVAVMPDVVLLL